MNRVGIIILGMLLLVPLAFALVEFSCETDGECVLFKGSGSSCVDNVCTGEVVEEIDFTPIEKFLAPEESPEWRGALPSREVSIDDLCDDVGCISLAPAQDSKYINRFLFAFGR